MKESYELKDIISTFVGRTEAAGETHIDDKTILNLKIALPQLFDAICEIFENASREAGRHEWSMQEIGKLKLGWAMEFKEFFDDLVPDKYDETTVS